MDTGHYRAVRGEPIMEGALHGRWDQQNGFSEFCAIFIGSGDTKPQKTKTYLFEPFCVLIVCGCMNYKYL